MPVKEWGTGQSDWTKLDHLIHQFLLPTAKRDGLNLKISGDAATIVDVRQLSVRGTYKAATWADLFDRIAESNTCIHFNVTPNRRELTFTSRDAAQAMSLLEKLFVLKTHAREFIVAKVHANSWQHGSGARQDNAERRS